ncbi:MAG TPA: hypothetical protein EYH14_00900 [Euryarchaeota archaeon]|nr:hypothetical protein [Euryarchaeota archaeon]
MDWKALLGSLVLPKLVLKVQMLAFVLFVAALLGHAPDWSGVLGFLFFFVTYLSTYFYNDLVDVNDDKKKAVYPAKLLARGWATQEEYLFIAVNLFAAGTLITALYNPLLGIVTFLAVFLNNVRSHVRGVLLRQLLLVIVEYLNFVAIWVSFYGRFPEMLASAVLLEYCFLYTLGHLVYKIRKPLRSVLMRPDCGVFAALSVILAVPTLYVLFRHWAGPVFGVGGALLYILPQQLRVRRGDLNDQAFVDRIFWQHSALMGITGLWYLAGALIILL